MASRNQNREYSGQICPRTLSGRSAPDGPAEAQVDEHAGEILHRRDGGRAQRPAPPEHGALAPRDQIDQHGAHAAAQQHRPVCPAAPKQLQPAVAQSAGGEHTAVFEYFHMASPPWRSMSPEGGIQSAFFARLAQKTLDRSRRDCYSIKADNKVGALWAASPGREGGPRSIKPAPVWEICVFYARGCVLHPCFFVLGAIAPDATNGGVFVSQLQTIRSTKRSAIRKSASSALTALSWASCPRPLRWRSPRGRTSTS